MIGQKRRSGSRCTSALVRIFFIVIVTTIAFPSALAFELRGADLVQSLAEVGRLIESILSNSYAVFFILVILLVILFFKIITAAAQNVPALRNVKIAMPLSLIITLSLVTGGMQSGLVDFVDRWLGGISKLLIIVIGAIIFFAIRAKTRSNVLPLLGAGLAVGVLGGFLGSEWLPGIGGLLFFFGILHFLTKESPATGSPYSHRHYKPSQRRRWFSRTRDAMDQMRQDLKEGYKRGSETTKKLKNLYERTKKKADVESSLNKIISLSDQQQRQLYDEFMSGKISPEMLTRRIDNLHRIAAELDHKASLLQSEEEYERATEQEIEQSISEEKQKDEDDIHRIHSLNIKDHNEKDLEHEVKNVIEDKKKIRHIVKDLRRLNKRKKGLRSKQKDEAQHLKKDIEKLERIVRLGNFDSKDVQEILKRISKHMKNINEYEDSIDFQKSFRESLRLLEDSQHLMTDETRMIIKAAKDLEAVKEDVEETQTRS